jgi:hypothetical protein
MPRRPTKPLSPEEKQLLFELLSIAQGMAMPEELRYLDSEQRRLIEGLRRKGYVRVGKRKFRVLFPPWVSDSNENA